MTEPQTPAEFAAAIDAARGRLIGFATGCTAADCRLHRCPAIRGWSEWSWTMSRMRTNTWQAGLGHPDRHVARGVRRDR